MSSFVLCVGCGTPLYGFSPCRWCTCEQCGIDLRDGICSLCNSMNSCVHDSDSNSFDYPPDSYNPPHPTYETYSGDSCRNDPQFGYDCPPQFPLNYEPEPGYSQNYNSYLHDSSSFPPQYPCCDDCGLSSIPGFMKILANGFHYLKSSLSLVFNLGITESEGENSCDVPSCFTTFSNILFNDEYEFDYVDDQSLHNEDFSEKIFSNQLFEEEIISIKKNHHHFNAESDLVESMLNHDSSIISFSLKIDSLLDEFAGELTLLKSISPGVDKTDCHPKNEIRLFQRLLYDNSSPRPPEEFNSENSNAEIESFSPSPIPNEDSDSFMEEIDLFLNSDDPMPPSIEDDDNDSKGDTLSLERFLHDDPIPLPDTLDIDFSYVIKVFLPFFTYPVTSLNLHPFGNEDTIFDPGITINHFYSLKPGSSHRHGAFKKFNTHRSHLNKWPMTINGKNIPLLDVLLFHFYPP
nr:pre-mRNA splicing Prp18-interacting factor [Tanacetum cinerariifolium]